MVRTVLVNTKEFSGLIFQPIPIVLKRLETVLPEEFVGDGLFILEFLRIFGVQLDKAPHLIDVNAWGKSSGDPLGRSPMGFLVITMCKRFCDFEARFYLFSEDFRGFRLRFCGILGLELKSLRWKGHRV